MANRFFLNLKKMNWLKCLVDRSCLRKRIFLIGRTVNEQIIQISILVVILIFTKKESPQYKLQIRSTF